MAAPIFDHLTMQQLNAVLETFGVDAQTLKEACDAKISYDTEASKLLQLDANYAEDEKALECEIAALRTKADDLAKARSEVFGKIGSLTKALNALKKSHQQVWIDYQNLRLTAK